MARIFTAQSLQNECSRRVHFTVFKYNLNKNVGRFKNLAGFEKEKKLKKNIRTICSLLFSKYYLKKEICNVQWELVKDSKNVTSLKL